MSNEPIDPNGIPQFTGDLEQLERDVADLRREASQFRDAGGDVHSDFQGLSAFYEAPEAEQLFATTKPVRTKTDEFADDLEKVAQALSRYATRVRPIVKKLKDLQTEASAFYIDEISTDDDWRKDDDKREHNNRLVEEVKGYTQTFRIAEMDCHNAITALVGGIRLTLSDDGTSSCGTYGYTDRVLDQAEKFPWGGKVEKERDGLDWLAHKALDVGKGFFVDGVGGTINALGTLAGKDGWGAAGEAWKNLAKLGTGLSLTMTPVGGLFWMAKDEQLPGWLRDSRRAVVDTGKGLIAYDQWSKNPARAGGLVGFNAVTIVATRGAGSAAKAGAAAKTVSAIGKFGRAVDPFSYAAKGVQFGVTKVGDLMAPLKGTRSGAYADMADGPYRLAERGADVPSRPASVPDDARAYVNRKGDTIFMTREGVIVDDQGKVLGNMAKAEEGLAAPSAGERGAAAAGEPPPVVRAPDRQPALVGAHVGDDAVGAAGRGGDGLPRSAADHTPGGSAHDLGGGAAARHEPSGGSSNHPPGAHGDGATHAGQGLGGGRGADGPGEGMASHGDGPGGSGGSGAVGHGSDLPGRVEGTPLDPQPSWHGASADAMRHHRRPAVYVGHLSPDEKLVVLEREARTLADDARAAAAGDNPGRHRLEQGCAGSFLHDNVVTVHSSTTKMHGQKIPRTHPVLQDLLKQIKADSAAGLIGKTGIGHGKCAEISLISDRLHQLDPVGTRIRTVDDARRVLEGGVMHTRRINDSFNREGVQTGWHSEYMKPCGTCEHVLSNLGIRAYE